MPIRGPPVRFLNSKLKNQQEDKTVKYTPKKVFILEEGKYKEISYGEFQRRERENEQYRDKRFLSLHGMLMEVTEEDYISYYKDKRRQRYIEERAKKFGTFSYDALTTDEFNGEDILVDSVTDIEAEVQTRYFTEKLRAALSNLSDEERVLIKKHFFDGLSQVEISREYGVNQSNISRRIARILLKLKNFIEK